MKKLFVLTCFLLLSGCIVNKPNITIADSQEIMLDSSGRMFSASTVAHVDAQTSSTATVEGNQGSGGAGGMLAQIWSYIIGWFGVGGSI
jgi:uncharacterized protein YcfL